MRVRRRSRKLVQPCGFAIASMIDDCSYNHCICNHEAGERSLMQNTTLESWLAEEREALARLEAGPGPGLARPEQIEGMTGLEIMQAMLRGDIPYAAIAKTLDFTVLSVSPGVAVFQGTPLPQHLNPLGSVHGGW